MGLTLASLLTTFSIFFYNGVPGVAAAAAAMFCSVAVPSIYGFYLLRKSPELWVSEGVMRSLIATALATGFVWLFVFQEGKVFGN